MYLFVYFYAERGSTKTFITLIRPRGKPVCRKDSAAMTSHENPLVWIDCEVLLALSL